MIRDVIHVGLYVLIGLLALYVIIEQVGTWLRRRSGRG